MSFYDNILGRLAATIWTGTFFSCEKVSTSVSPASGGLCPLDTYKPLKRFYLNIKTPYDKIIRSLLCRQSRHLSRNQDFDLFKQKNKQTGSIGLKALKPAVFLIGNEFRLRIPFGKLIRFPNPSAL